MRKSSSPPLVGTRQQFSALAFTGATIPPAAYLPFIYMPIAAACSAVGVSGSRIYELIRAGEFPPGDLIAAQSRRWKSIDVAIWLQQRAAKAAQREADHAAT